VRGLSSRHGLGLVGVASFCGALFAACGGKVVLEEESDEPPCGCTDDSECPADDACGNHSCQRCECVVIAEPYGSDCGDGYCDKGTCISRDQICRRACEVIPVCLTSGPQECYDFCFADLEECSSQQMADTDSCTDELVAPECDGEAWLECVLPIACLETDEAG